MRVELDELGFAEISELTIEQAELILAAVLAQAEKPARKASYSNFLRRLAMGLDRVLPKLEVKPLKP